MDAETNTLTTTPEKVREASEALLLELYEGDDIIECVALDDRPSNGSACKGRRACSRDMFLDCDSGLFDWIAQQVNAGLSVSMGHFPRKAMKGSGRDHAARAEDIARIGHLFADVDDCTDEIDAQYSIVKRIEKHKLPPPTMMIWTGGGIRVIWALTAPISPDEFKRLTTGVIIPLLGSDQQAKNLVQLVRMPGVFNRKPNRPDSTRYVHVIEESLIRGHRVKVERFTKLYKAPLRAMMMGGAACEIGDDTLAYLEHGAPDGKRDNSLFKAACDFNGCGKPQHEAEERLIPRAVADGLDAELARRKIASAYSKPRTPARALTLLDHSDPDKAAIIVNGVAVPEAAGLLRDALLAANEPEPRLFRSNGQLSYVADCDGRLCISLLNRSRLAFESENAATPYTLSSKGESRAVSWPEPILSYLMHALNEDQAIPTLRSITNVPCLRADGTILTQPGYDASTQMIYRPNLVVPQVPEAPSQQDVTRAKAILFEPFEQFPFDGDASRANYFGLLLLPAIRGLIDGCTPLHLITAPTAGSGKTMLAEAVALIYAGTAPWFLQYSNDPDDLSKRILSGLLSGNSIAVMDNVDTVIRSPILAMMLTSPEFSDRQLGRNDEGSTRRVEQRATWIATGNNISLAGDIARRVCWIRLDPRDPHPERRNDFRIADFKQYIRQHRGELLWAILTLARAWIVAGKPSAPSTPAVGSFASWASNISGLLAFIGLEGFYTNTAAMNASSDDEANDWDTFLSELYWKTHRPSNVREGIAFTVQQLSQWIENDHIFAATVPADVATLRDRKHFGKLLGHALRKQSDRIRDTLVLRKGKQHSHNKVATWQVCVVDNADPPPRPDSLGGKY